MVARPHVVRVEDPLPTHAEIDAAYDAMVRERRDLRTRFGIVIDDEGRIRLAKAEAHS